MHDRRQSAALSLAREETLLAPGVSVVIPCYNSSSTLPDLIAGLAESTTERA